MGSEAEPKAEAGPKAEARLQIWGSGRQASKASLRDGVVLRTPGPWSQTVIALLRHLENEGFTGAPRVVGTGFADDGREAVTFIPGTTPHPHAWNDEAAAVIGQLLRDLHRAASTFKPPKDARWKPWFARDLPGSYPVISHGDTGPWNLVAQDGLPVAFVDWEYAGPVDAVWALAEAAWLNAQLHDDDVADRFDLPDAPARARQVRWILDGYGLSTPLRVGFVDKMIEFAVHSAREDAVEFNVTPETESAVSDTGFPFLWGITWRVRAASWMLRNRALLERAIT